MMNFWLERFFFKTNLSPPESVQNKMMRNFLHQNDETLEKTFFYWFSLVGSSTFVSR